MIFQCISSCSLSLSNYLLGNSIYNHPFTFYSQILIIQNLFTILPSNLHNHLKHFSSSSRNAFSKVNESFQKYIFRSHSKVAFENVFFESYKWLLDLHFLEAIDSFRICIFRSQLRFSKMYFQKLSLTFKTAFSETLVGFRKCKSGSQLKRF